eukprot:COSAG01_NODE_4837_length_4695_cov_90.434508_5_plen_71_part_00
MTEYYNDKIATSQKAARNERVNSNNKMLRELIEVIAIVSKQLDAIDTEIKAIKEFLAPYMKDKEAGWFFG